MRTFGEMADDNFESEGRRLRSWTPLKLFGVIVAGLLVLSICGGAVGLAAGWFNAGKQIISADNVKKQWAFAYTYDEALGQAAQNWCTAKKAEDAEPNPDYKAQLRLQTQARDNVYTKIQAEYNAKLRNAFEAKWVKPADVPTIAPTLSQKVDELGLVGCVPA